MFSVRNCGKTLVSRTQGTKIATEELKGRVLEVNLADLNNDEDQASKKVRLCIEEVQGRSCLTDFHGMTLTRDKICSLIKKWQTLIEAHVDVKTTDNYIVRMFCIAFTKRRPEQVKSNCYAQSAQIRKIRRKMVEIMTQEASKVQLRELVKKLIPESIGKEIEKQTQGIFPLKDCLIRKVKIMKKPKFDITKLMELHGDGGDDVGVEMMRPEAEDAMNTLSADVAAADDVSGTTKTAMEKSRVRFLHPRCDSGLAQATLVPRLRLEPLTKRTFPQLETALDSCEVVKKSCCGRQAFKPDAPAAKRDQNCLACIQGREMFSTQFTQSCIDGDQPEGMASLRSSKWDFLQDEPELDGEEGDFSQASSLREQANALSHHARQEQEPRRRQQHLCEALGMYRKADALLGNRCKESREAWRLALQCRLNAACLAMQVVALAGADERQQAEVVATHFANAALEIDPENPHAALILARSQRGLAEQHLRNAQVWAQKRKDEDAAEQAAELAKSLRPAWQTQVDSPSVWVQKGAELFKRGQTKEAECLLRRAVEYIDRKENGGPIDSLSTRAARALAFDALEVLAECLAARRDFEGSLRCGRRAADLLEVGVSQVPFTEPECSRREGLLYLSLGHASEAAGEKEALSFFRRAAQALQRSNSPALEGTALLEFGLRLAQDFDAGDPNAADLAMPTLERAIEKLKLAHGQQLKGTKDDRVEVASSQKPAVASERLLRRQLQAQVAVCSLHLSLGDSAAAEEVLNESRHLVDAADDGQSATRLEWARLCGQWAFAAAQVGRLAEAEEALRAKWRRAGGKDPEWGQDGSDLQLLECSSCQDPEALRLQQEALQSLALVRQKACDAVGVEDAMSRLSRATPERSRGDVQKEMQHHLQRLAREESTSPEPVADLKECDKKASKASQTLLLQKGAWLAGLSALIIGISATKLETMKTVVWPLNTNLLQNWSFQLA
ncbi:RPS3A [Symbiodinium sp. KB8]|nr:RPS3A [Symbiodinium sp. KB8]